MAVAAFRKRPLLRWIILAGVLIALPVAYAVNQWTRQAILLDLNGLAQEELKVQQAYLQSRVQGLRTITRIVGTDERVRSSLKNPNDPHLLERVNQHLSRLLVTAGCIAYIMDLKGRVLASGNWDARDSFVGWDLSFRPYFQKAATGETALYVAVGVISRRLGFYIAEPIYIDGEIEGVAVTKTDPQTLVIPQDHPHHPFLITDSIGVVIISRPELYLYHMISGSGEDGDNREDRRKRFPEMEIHPITTAPVQHLHQVSLISLPVHEDSHQNSAATTYVLAGGRVANTDWTAHVLWPVQDLNTTVVHRVLLSLLAMAVSWLVAIFVVERWRNLKQMQQQAFRDPLTRLYSRLYMLESATSLLAAHDRRSIPGLSAVMFDLDRFKAINDRYGHSAGDGVLVKVADVLLNECRESDIPIRYGGEEFLIFVPNENRQQVFQLAERIRRQIKRLEINLAGTMVELTISGGIATHMRGETLEKLIDRADRMMYEAKQKGRDCVIAETGASSGRAH